MIVFTHKDHRQLPQGGKIHIFVESALVAAAVTRKGNRHLVRGIHGAIQGMAGSQRLRGTHDAVGTHEPHLRGTLVHFARTSAAQSLLLAHKLGHH